MRGVKTKYLFEYTVRKGTHATLQAAADREGKSLNTYVNKAVLARLGLEEWPEVEGERGMKKKKAWLVRSLTHAD